MIRPFAVLIVAVVLFAIVAAAPPPGKPAAASPPEGAVEFAGHRYLAVDDVEQLSWSGARDQCVAWGGHLAVVTSEEESDFITGLCDGRYLYLGASDAAEEGTWVWVDGSEWDFTNWAKGQPNNYGGKEDYLATYSGGGWVDVDHEGEDFWMPTGFICEWPPQS